jgi:hypothetical protein
MGSDIARSIAEREALAGEIAASGFAAVSQSAG